MAHFAKISEENKVLSVHAVNDSKAPTEAEGQAHLQKIHSWPAHLWIQCSYNTWNGVHKTGGTPFRGNFPSIGFTWDSTNQIFICNKSFPSWTLNIAEARWQSPVGDAPDLTQEQEDQNLAGTHVWQYVWDESGQTWNLENTSF